MLDCRRNSLLQSEREASQPNCASLLCPFRYSDRRFSRYQCPRAIEFIYTIKERAHVQVGDIQPDTLTERLFGDGDSGDADLTALTSTPESGDPIVIPAADGEFDSETGP